MFRISIVIDQDLEYKLLENRAVEASPQFLAKAIENFADIQDWWPKVDVQLHVDYNTKERVLIVKERKRK